MFPVFRFYSYRILKEKIPFLWVFVLTLISLSLWFSEPIRYYSTERTKQMTLQQVILFGLWAFSIFQCSYWSAGNARHRQDSGLALFWHGSGISTLSQILQQLFAVYIYPLVFTLLYLPFLFLSFPSMNFFALHLLFEAIAFYLMATLLILLIAQTVSAKINTTIGFLLSSGLAISMIIMNDFIRTILSRLPFPLQEIITFFYGLLPQFGFFYRPGAVYFLWPPMSFVSIIAVILYGVIYALILIKICHITSKPKLQ